MKFPMLPIKMPRIPQKVTRAIGKLALRTRKAKPDIFIIGGLLLGGSAVVVAVTDTWKNKDKIQNDISTIKQLKASEEPSSEELFKARKQMAIDVFKTFWKSAALGTGSVIFIIHGRTLMRKQIAELSAMYAALLESYRRYRSRVIAEYGPEKDQEFFYGIKTIETIDAETGETIEKTLHDGGRMASPYAVYLTEGDFDDVNCRWRWRNKLYDKDKRKMAANLLRIQSECNDILRMYGWLTLNTVKRKLSLPLTKAGQHVGWVRGGLANGIKGNDFVDFGIFPDYENGKYQLPINKKFLDPNSNQQYPLIDFNVICIDAIWDDFYEYDNCSDISYEERRAPGLEGSTEDLERFWYNDYLTN